MATKPQSGLFGFDVRSEEERLADAARDRANRLIQNVNSISQGYRTAGARQATQFGGMLGAVIGQKISPAQLTEQDKRDLAIQSAARAKYAERLSQASVDGPLTPEDKSLLFQDSMADAAFDNGEFGLYNQIAVQSAQMRRQRAIAQAQLDSYEANTASTKQNSDLTGLKIERAKAGDTIQAILPEQNGKYNPDSILSPVNGKLMPDGTFRVYAADGSFEDHKQFLPYDAAQKTFDILSDAANKQGKGGAVQAVKNLWDNTERREGRSVARDVRSQVRIVDGVVGLLEKLNTQGLSPDTALANQGKILGFVDNIRAMFKSGVDYSARIMDENGRVITTGDFRSQAQVEQMRKQDPRFAAAMDQIDTNLASSLSGAKEQAEYRSAIIQLAFAVARTREASARQLSNQDIDLALEQIGGNAGSADKMLAVVMDNITRGLEDFGDRVSQYRNIGMLGGLSPQQVDIGLFGGGVDETVAALTKLQDRVNTFNTMYQKTQALTQGQRDAQTLGVSPAKESDDDLINRVLGQ